jgi:hypothetical protein
MKKTILFLFAITLFSCKKDGFDEAPVPFEVLGSWQWVSTYNGWGGDLKVDSSKLFILTLLPNKKYIWCKNGDCSLGSFFYGTRLSSDKTITSAMMSFSRLNAETEFPFERITSGIRAYVSNDKISFADYCDDCNVYLFNKKK